MRLQYPLRLLLIGLAVSASGCATMGEHLQQYVAFKREQHEAHVEERQACHDSKLAEHELAAQHARRGRIDSLRSTLALDLDQRFVVSELAVDESELKDLMAQRDKDYAELKAIWDQVEKEMLQARTELEVQSARKRLDALARVGAQKGCWAPAPPCIPEAPARVPELPAKRPIMPAEIPLVMRARLQVGIGEAALENARIRRLPQLPAKAPCGPPPGHPDKAGGYCPPGVDCPLPPPPQPENRNVLLPKPMRR